MFPFEVVLGQLPYLYIFFFAAAICDNWLQTTTNIVVEFLYEHNFKSFIVIIASLVPTVNQEHSKIVEYFMYKASSLFYKQLIGPRPNRSFLTFQ